MFITARVQDMKIYAVITVFQGVFDDIVLYTNEDWADAYMNKLKKEGFSSEDLEIQKRCLDVDIPTQ